MKKISWNITLYEPKYRDAVLQLMELVQKHKTTPETFIWWFENNPTKDLNIYLAKHADKIIGVSCHTTFKMLHNGEEHIISFPLNVLTHPDYRGQGIFSKLQIANEEHAKKIGCPFMLSFPNAVSTPIFLNKFEWKQIKPSILYFRPLQCENIADKISFISWTSRFFKLFNPIFKKEFRIDKYNFSTEEACEFDEWSNDIFEANKPLLENCIVKSKEYLNWRFIQDPQKKYSLFKIKRGNSIIGYYVLGKITKKRLVLGYVANALLLPEYHHHFFDIQNFFMTYFKSMNIDLILGWDTHFFKLNKPFYLSGYLPLTKRFNFIYKINSPNYSEEEFENYRHWFLQLGDLDFF